MMQKLLTLALTSSIAISPIAPAFAEDALNIKANQGDTSKALPDVGNVCKRVKDAAEGNFVNVDGTPVLVTKDSCLGKSRRERNAPDCKVKVSEMLAGMDGEAKQKKVDQICSTGSGSLGQAGDAYCNLRQIGKTGQAVQYCEAYDAANRAQKGLKWVWALDAAAAGICWAEFLAAKAKMNAGAAHLGGKGLSNAKLCGGAAMGAALGEVLQTGKVLFGNQNSAGKFKIDSNNNVKNRGGFLKTFEVLASAGLSAKAVRIGICYYHPENKICGDLKEGIANRNKKAKSYDKRVAYEDRTGKAGFKVQTGLNKQLEGLRIKDPAMMEKGKVLAQKGVEEGETAAEDDKKYMQMDMAFEAAKIFTALTAMRSVAMLSAAATKKKAGAILQSMFQGDAGGPAFGASAMSANNGNMFTAAAEAGFSSPTNQGTQSSVTATLPDDAMESFLSPPGSPIGDKAEGLAKQIPESKLDDAANGGASGTAGLIAMTATAAGARGDLSPIHSAVTSAFANLPREDGGYNGGGGGARPMAGGSKDGDLNLKSLFGAGEKTEETSPGRTDMAFREPASAEDIWHSQNPHGNNLFQIISGKYDHVQRRFAIGEGL